MSTSQAYEDLDRTPERVRVTDEQILNPNNETVLFGGTPMKGTDLKHLQRALERYIRTVETQPANSTLVDASTNDNSIKKQGDTVMMPLSAFNSDPTQKLLMNLVG